MASYSKFLGRAVTVNYRVGDIMLPASGTFVGDSGRSIFLEQHVEQRGRLNYFRWEIPYQYIHRIVETDTATEATTEEDEADPSSPDPEAAQQLTEDSSAHPSALAAKAASGASPLLPFSHRPKTA
jgi:hypothetical protein